MVILAGCKNKGLLPGLLRLIYEETGSFDNYAVSITKITFAIETHTSDSSMSKCRFMVAETFENFADFIQYFDIQSAKRLYNDLVVIRLCFEVSSKLDPLYSCRKELVFVALPFLCDSKVTCA